LVFIKETIEPRFLRKIVYRLLSFFADYFVPNSKVIEQEFIEITGNKNISTVYSTVENELDNTYTAENALKNEIAPHILERLINRNTFKLLSVGNIKKIKNQLLILQSLSLLNSKDFSENLDLFLVGDTKEESSYFEQLSHFISENKLTDNVHFLDVLNKDSLKGLYKYVDTLIVSSISEGVPLVLVYALKYKKYIISTNVGGISDIIQDGYNGILIDILKESLSNAIEKLYHGKDGLSYMKENAYNTYLEKFNREENMKRLEEIIINTSK